MSRQRFSAVATRLIPMLVLVLHSGCGGGVQGPPLAPVHGKVTLDGEPLSDARVEFIPSNGRPSVAITKPDGTYELIYTENQNGAIVGSSFKVEITTGKSALSAEGVQIQPEVKEKLPAKYHSRSTLTADVKKGANVFDFNLSSKD